MSGLLPDGEDLRKAVKWVSAELQKNPVQPLQPLVQRVLHHGLYRCKAGPAREKDHGFVAVFAQEEGAEWTLEAQDVPLLHLAENMLAEGAPVVSKV